MEESILPHDDFESDSDVTSSAHPEQRDAKPILCRGCLCCFPNISEYQVHQDECQAQQDECTPVSSDQNILKRIKSENGLEHEPSSTRKRATTSKYYCDLCYVPLPNRLAFKEHKKEHVNKVRHLCDQCSYFTLSPWKLEEHKKKHNDLREKSFKCGAMLRTSQGYKTHLQIHEKICPSEISKILDSGVSFIEVSGSAVAKDNKKKPPKCKSKSSIVHKCGECSFTTENHLKLSRHKLSHALTRVSEPRPVKIYKCTQCIFQTDFRNSMTLHEAVHERYKPVACSLCDQVCKGAEALDNHLTEVHHESHHAVKAKTYSSSTPVQFKYKCKECDFTCSAKKDFDRHRISHGMHPYHCQFCGARFKYGGNVLLKHVRKWHPEELAEEDDASMMPVCFEANLLNVQLRENVAVEPDWLEKVLRSSDDDPQRILDPGIETETD